MLRFLIPGWSLSYMNWYKVYKSNLLSNFLISWSVGDRYDFVKVFCSGENVQRKYVCLIVFEWSKEKKIVEKIGFSEWTLKWRGDLSLAGLMKH